MPPPVNSAHRTDSLTWYALAGKTEDFRPVVAAAAQQIFKALPAVFWLYRPSRFSTSGGCFESEGGGTSIDILTFFCIIRWNNFSFHAFIQSLSPKAISHDRPLVIVIF
jgi:hypothetical protein